MAAPYNNIRSKLNRAIAAHLVNQGAGQSDDVLPAHTRLAKVAPNTTVRSRAGKPNMEFHGNYDVMVHLIIRGSATQELSETDDEAARREFDERIARTFDAMMLTDDGQTLRYTAKAITSAGRALAVDDGSGEAATLRAQQNADMADFTCLFVKDMGFGDASPNEQEVMWEEILAFEITCCGSNIGGYSLED